MGPGATTPGSIVGVALHWTCDMFEKKWCGKLFQDCRKVYKKNLVLTRQCVIYWGFQSVNWFICTPIIKLFLSVLNEHSAIHVEEFSILMLTSVHSFPIFFFKEWRDLLFTSPPHSEPLLVKWLRDLPRTNWCVFIDYHGLFFFPFFLRAPTEGSRRAANKYCNNKWWN